MRRHRLPPLPFVLLGLSLLAVVALAASGCHRGDDEASVERRLDQKGTMDVVEEAAKDEYDPPSDGELSEKQMDMYLEVETRAAKIRQVAQKRMEERTGKDEGDEAKKPGLFDALRAVGDLGDLVTAELRAAKELGYNAAEFQWVKQQVVEAQVAMMGQQMRAGFAAVNQQVLDAMEAQKQAATDDEQRRQIEQQIADYKENAADAQQGDEMEPGVEHNIELVKRYQERLQKVEQAASEQADSEQAN